jgi:uncharacterized protein (TIGR02145 family)
MWARRSPVDNIIAGSLQLMSLRTRAVAIALSMACGSVGAASMMPRTAQRTKATGVIPSSKRMPDGRQWTTDNLNVVIDHSYCYDNEEQNCRRYGRLYTWESAQRACRSLGGGWQLPANDEWHRMAKHFGGIRDESVDLGKAAYVGLLIGGTSGFNAVFGGGRAIDGQYTRLDAHGFYWTASESDPVRAWFYNFGRGGQSVGRHRDGEKDRAMSVRCIRE